MSLSVNIKSSRSFLEKKQARKKDEIEKRFNKALFDTDKICKMIIKKYNPLRIYQWGSLLDKQKFSLISDIDIALDGVKNAEEYFRILKDAEALTNLPLDIIEIEKIHPKHRDMILSKGKLIYERS